jgi:putative FmdB family regulatory protein
MIMPIYEYECEQCGVRFERLQRMTEAPLKDCPECGGHIHRIMQPVGVIFKGSGFYVTDNRGKSSTGIPARKKEDESKPTSGEVANPAPAAETKDTNAKSSTTSKGAED